MSGVQSHLWLNREFCGQPELHETLPQKSKQNRAQMSETEIDPRDLVCVPSSRALVHREAEEAEAVNDIYGASLCVLDFIFRAVLGA